MLQISTAQDSPADSSVHFLLLISISGSKFPPSMKNHTRMTRIEKSVKGEKELHPIHNHYIHTSHTPPHQSHPSPLPPPSDSQSSLQADSLIVSFALEYPVGGRRFGDGRYRGVYMLGGGMKWRVFGRSARMRGRGSEERIRRRMKGGECDMGVFQRS